MALSISELARGGGVGVETVRYYQRRGLLQKPETKARHGGGYRHYGDEDQGRLRFVKTAQVAGFTLDEIGELLALDAQTDRSKVRELARARIAALDLKIADLKFARQSLNKLVQQCAAGEGDDCPIISAFDRA